MIRRLAGVLLAACALFALLASSAVGEVPAGPRLAFVQTNGSKDLLLTANAEGGEQLAIAGGGNHASLAPFPLNPPTWSADGSQLAFSGISESAGNTGLAIYAVAADGTGLAKVRGTDEGLSPVLSPDGHTLAFSRLRLRLKYRHGHRELFESASVWLVGLSGGRPKQITPWRNHISAFPSSFSPDGSTLAISREYDEEPSRDSAVAVNLEGGGETVLVRHAIEPVYSPDGTHLALTVTDKLRPTGKGFAAVSVIPSDLAVANADGSDLTKLTKTAGSELTPSWDPSGQRLAYTGFKAAPGGGGPLGGGDSIMEINADGTCRTRVLRYPKSLLFGATWQPGPGREAGPIAC